MSKLVYGVGFPDKTVDSTSVLYNAWLNVIRRATGSTYKEKNKTYEKVTVDKKWLFLSEFKVWFAVNHKPNWHLDKDLLSVGKKEKVYGPNTCVYLPQDINKAIIPLIKLTAKGVYKRNNKYVVQVKVDGKNKNFGTYTSRKQAEAKYFEVKIEVLKKLEKLHKTTLTPLAHKGLKALIAHVTRLSKGG